MDLINIDLSSDHQLQQLWTKTPTCIQSCWNTQEQVLFWAPDSEHYCFFFLYVLLLPVCLSVWMISCLLPNERGMLSVIRKMRVAPDLKTASARRRGLLWGLSQGEPRGSPRRLPASLPGGGTLSFCSLVRNVSRMGSYVYRRVI